MAQVSESEIRKKENKVPSFLSARKLKESDTDLIEVLVDAYKLSINTSNEDFTQSGNIPNLFVFNEDYWETMRAR